MRLNYFVSNVKKLHMLVVEDNIIYGKFIQSLLTEYGIKSDLVENGSQAIEKIKNSEYDIVLMDVKMPVMDGYQTTAIIRNDLQSNIPIIAMTATDNAEEHKKCIEMGMNDCVAKPVSTEVLFEKIYCASITKETEAEPQVDATSKLINLDFLVENIGEKEEELIDIIDVFRVQLPKDVEELSDAIAKKDYSGITHYAHRMKSTVSLMGASKILDLANEIEILGRAETGMEKIYAIHESIAKLSVQAMEEMQEERDRLKSQTNNKS